MKIRTLLFLLALTMFTLTVGAQITITSSPDANGVTWSYTLDASNNATVTGVTLPATFGGTLVFMPAVDGNNVVGIGNGVSPIFADPLSLNGIDFSGLNNLTAINDYAFATQTQPYLVQLSTPLVIPSNISAIGVRAFRGISVPALDLTGADNLEYIELGAFGEMTILTNSTIVIPSKVTYIGGHCFYQIFGAAVTLDLSKATSLTTIGSSTGEGAVFYGYGSSSAGFYGDLVIPDNVTTITDTSFAQCSFTSVTVGSGVTSVGSQVFNNCERLTTVVINSPAVLPSMFVNCPLTSIDMSANSIGSSITSLSRTSNASIFNGVPANAIVKLPANTPIELKGAADDVNYDWSSVPAGITIVNADDTEIDTSVYTIDGRYVGNDINTLGKGVYIVGGKKIAK